MTTPVTTEYDLSKYNLSSGSHQSFDEGYCVMELVSHLANEPWSCHPQCVDEVITNIAVPLNDWMTQDERNTHLLPLVVGMIDTKGDIALLQRRAFLCADYAVRKVAPIGLDAAGLKEQAQTLRDLSPVVDGALAKSAAAAAAEAAAQAWEAAQWAEAWAAESGKSAALAAESAGEAAAEAAQWAAAAGKSAALAAKSAAAAAAEAAAALAAEELAAESGKSAYRLEIITLCCDLIREMCAMKEQSSNNNE